MEPPRAGALTPQEKAQLKEKLAVLKREYSRTVHRLQRAERAEKVKSHVKKTVAEQNLLLLQGKNGKDYAETLNRASHKGSPAKDLAGPCSPEVPTKTASVTFKPEPEVFSPGACLPPSPVSKHTSKGCEKPCTSLEGPVPGRRQSQLSRRKTRVSWRVGIAWEEREASPAPQTLQGGAGSELEHRAAGTRSSRSPVFKRRRSSKILETDATCMLSRTRGGSDGVGVAALEPKSSQGTLFPGLSHPLVCGSSQARPGSSLGHPCEAGILASGEGAMAESTVPQASSQGEGKESAPLEKARQCERVGEEDLGRWRDLAAPKGPQPQLDEERSCQEPETSGTCKGTSPVSGPNAKDLGDALEAGTSLLEGNPSAASPEKVLSSCTVVEGLLFPVEYYVRTTRRMSRCPREVNVEAVLQSQLGRSRRGQRGSRREKAGSSILLSPQEVAGGGDSGPASDANGSAASPSQPVSPPRVSGPVSSTSPAESQEVLPPPSRSGRPSGRASSSSSCTSQGVPEAVHPEGAGRLPPQRKGACWGESKAGARGRRGQAPKRPGSPVPESDAGQSASGLSGNSTLCLFESQPPEQGGHRSQPGPQPDGTASPPDESPEASLEGSGARTLGPPTPGRPSWAPEEEAPNREEGQSPAAESPVRNRDTPEQKGMAAAGGPAEAPAAAQSEGRLWMTSKLKSSAGSRLVDVGTLWWEVAGSTELCLVTATETTVTLWRHLDLPGCWEAACTWHVAKVPVFRLVPLPGVCSHVCLALGGQEVKELRFLFPSLEAGCFEQSLVKAGDIKAVLGLQHRRLVTGCGSLREQAVEVVSFSEAGRSRETQVLMAPEEALTAFAEVDGMEEALVGMTTGNCVVVW
ncbi:hypothetical protein JRQ81_010245 [Phrynocephalus forsythii]|uniref:Partner and localiser of BRCA2 WD40 domain-containing protein n=1 Tax=Phrynocephalus forsythii TaxID=171643 RepID=A0A9Q1AR52_9SAUR|nr:hypothetical protein JRQ81_010245 [Phrynocephalus forsythii]